MEVIAETKKNRHGNAGRLRVWVLSEMSCLN